MPWTYWTLLVGAIASAGMPPFAGFFSKDAIIEAVKLSQTPGAGFAYLSVLSCVFVTAAYTFRLVFMAFHGEPRFDAAHAPHESPAVVTVPLVLLAIPSIASGWLIGSVVFGGYFSSAITVSPAHANIAQMTADYHGLWGYMLHGMSAPPFWLALAGIGTAYYLYRVRTDLPKRIAIALGPLYALVERKYGFDELYQWLFAGGARLLGTGLWKGGDERTIDGVIVNGSARLVGWFSGVLRLLQTGYIYQYAFAMIFGVLLIMTWFLFLAPRA
jgi:NADH-quinone oxidoreductase subunit L